VQCSPSCSQTPGGADEIVDTIVGHASPRALPWAMALLGAIIGLPMFFEIGLVLLMPVIYLVARWSRLSVITVGIPALAGLPAMHGLVPPHPRAADRHPAVARRPRRHAAAGRSQS
jgi:H+/gluconate symporter-like permease